MKRVLFSLLWLSAYSSVCNNVAVSATTTVDAKMQTQRDARGGSQPNQAEEPLIGTRSAKSEALNAKIKTKLEDADGSDEVFRIAEDIPAIQRCTDKALSIARADIEDAGSAVVAIHRLASLCVEPNKWALTVGDRRFDQLSDCVDLQLPNLAILDLCKYLWAISVIRSSDEERSRVVFTEFLRRIEDEGEGEEEGLSVGHLSTMFWTLGCVRNNLGWTDNTLFARLRGCLLSKPLESLNERLLVRILWTLLVHKDHSDESRSLVREVVSLLDSRGTYSALGTHHISTMLLACSDLHLTEEASSWPQLARMLGTLEGRIGEADFGVGEVNLAAQALSATYVGIENLMQKLKNVEGSSEGANGKEDGLARLSDLASEVQGTTGALLAFSLEKLSLLGLDSYAALMQAIVAVLPNNNELTRAFTDASVDRVSDLVEGYQEHIGEWSPSVAAYFLDSISRLTWNVRPDMAANMGVFGKDRLDVELMQAKRQREHRAQHLSDGSDEASGVGALTAFQKWQRLAGFCSAICSLQASNINDAQLLLDAAHGCESYHRPCAPLIREVQRQFLSEGGLSLEAEKLSPAHLARLGSLMVVMHGQRGSRQQRLTPSSWAYSAGEMEPAARQLASMASSIPSVAERIGALVALSSLVSRETLSSPFYVEAVQKAGIDFDSEGLSTVRTRTLVRFLQSDVLAKNEAMAAAATKALRKRKVDIALAETLLLSTDDGEPSTRLSLLAQLLHDWRSHHNRRQSRTDDSLLRTLVECVKEALRDALPLGVLQTLEGHKAPTPTVDAEGGEPDDDPEADEGGGAVLVGTSTDLIALAQVLEVLSAYEYRDSELSRLVGLFTDAALEHGGTLEQSSDDCRRLFDLGKLEGMLQHYLHIEQAKADPHLRSVFGFASGVARTFIPHIRNAFAGKV